MATRAPSPVGAAAVVQEVPTYAGGAEPQIEPPMPPGMGGAVPSAVNTTGMLGTEGEQTPRARSAPPASFSIHTPGPVVSGAEGVRVPASPPTPAGATSSGPAGATSQRAASPSPTPGPRAQGDPWHRPAAAAAGAEDGGSAAFMGQMAAMMAAMQRTIDALTL